MESKKRERSSNFVTAEVQLLVSLVEKYKRVIEYKKTDSVTNKAKECAWKKIESAFNSCGVTTSIRSWKTLKLKYEGLKKNMKKKSALHRQNMYKSGGPSNAPNFNDVEEKVLSICSNIGLEPRHDSNTITIPLHNEGAVLERHPDLEKCNEEGSTVKNLLKLPEMEESNILEKNEDNESQKELPWDKWQPSSLQNRISNILKSHTANKSSVTEKLDKLSSARLELVHLKMEIARKQYRFMEEEHRLKIIYLENDEKRKQEIHELILKKINSAPVVHNNSMMI